MKIETLYIKPDSAFSAYVKNWAEQAGVPVQDYELKMVDDQIADGLLLVNENQDIPKDLYDFHTYFDHRHIPTQKIDVNGTLQVALTSFDMWLSSNKCKKILILGADNLVKNDNLERFFSKVKMN